MLASDQHLHDGCLALIGPLFNSDPENFRIVTPDVGGGFGMKLFLYAEHVLTCFASRALGRPVKWASDRAEAFLCDTQGRDNVTTGELAIDANGEFVALRTRTISNMGAYLSNFAPYIPTYAGTSVLSSVAIKVFSHARLHVDYPTSKYIIFFII